MAAERHPVHKAREPCVPLATCRIALTVHRILAALYESAERGREVAI